MSCCLTKQKYEERQKMVQLSMLLKLLKNMVIILALMIMRWIILKIKCCPSPVYKEERVQNVYYTLLLGKMMIS